MDQLTMQLAARGVARTHVAAVSAKDKMDAAIMRYDAWFLVLIAVLMVLAFVVATALAIWCLVYKDRRFTGNWRWNTRGVSVWAECR